jgi:hypothetical protein
MARELIERVRELSRSAVPMFAQIERWAKKELTPSNEQEFARLAGVLRWGRAGAVQVQDLLETRRSEDVGRSVWSVFNRVQEATTALSLPGTTASGRRFMSRVLAAPGANTQYNAELWQLAEEFSTI